MADSVFLDPSTGRTFTWRQYVAVVCRQTRARCPGVTESLLDDAVQYGLTDMERASKRHEQLRVDGGLLHWPFAVKWGRQRACQHIARYSRKHAHEVAAGHRADIERVADAHVDVATQVVDPCEVAASNDIYEHVHRFYDTMPDDVKADVALLFNESLSEVAEQLGVSRSAVAQRRAVLRRRIRALAIEAGLLMPNGTYDGGAVADETEVKE